MTLRTELFTPYSQRRTADVRDLLARHGIALGEDMDYIAGLYDDDKLVATGSLCGGVLKYIAVDESVRGQGASLSIVSELVSQAYRDGRSKLFLFTKPENEGLFTPMSFYKLAGTQSSIMMENSRTGLSSYLDSLPHPSGTAGAIVANCNPFTNGHLYLMQQAAQAVDVLHIFVLSENCSQFDADERFNLVKSGVAHIKNAYVHRSGDYIISHATFPTYFLKEAQNHAEINADLDLALFGLRIAPSLGITKRFVGTEPYCNVTNAYNERMKLILPQHGIEVVEIPRIGGISASRVRELLAAGDFDGIRELVPDVTYKYLLERAKKQ